MECLVLWIILLLYFATVCYGHMNVLFLVSDDMRPQLGSYYGKDFPSPVHPPMHTPNLDKLAAKSLLLRRAYCQQATCSPSRTSLLTGRRPDTTHVYDPLHYWRKVGGNFTTIPQYFKNYDYISVGMGKVFHGKKRASGPDDPISWSVPYLRVLDHSVNRSRLNSSWRAVPDELLKDRPLKDSKLTHHAIHTLRQLAPAAVSGSKPFFLAVGFHKPHLPFEFPESFLRYYPEESIRLPENGYAPVNMPSVAWSDYSELREFHDIQRLNLSGAINSTVPDNIVRDLRRAYYCAVTWTDFLIGRVIGELDSLGLTNNTIVSFWGDHGWQLGEHGEWSKHTNFELSTHAPMMIHIPGLTDSGIVTESLTEFVDLFPTLVEAAGLPTVPLCPENASMVEVCHEGSSLIPLIKNPAIKWKDASFSQFPRQLGTDTVMGYTMRTTNFRYTEWVRFRYFPEYKPDWSSLFGVELYDHRSDPEENHNVAFQSSYNHLRQELSRLLRGGWRQALPPPLL